MLSILSALLSFFVFAGTACTRGRVEVPSTSLCNGLSSMVVVVGSLLVIKLESEVVVVGAYSSVTVLSPGVSVFRVSVSTGTQRMLNLDCSCV